MCGQLTVLLVHSFTTTTTTQLPPAVHSFSFRSFQHIYIWYDGAITDDVQRLLKVTKVSFKIKITIYGILEFFLYLIFAKQWLITNIVRIKEQENFQIANRLCVNSFSPLKLV